MKVLSKNDHLCNLCRICESTCSKTWFKQESPEKSSIRINSDNEAKRIVVCTQCGKCINICQTQALYRDKSGVVRVSKENCVGCFMCVGFCPEGAMFMHEEHIEPIKCIACGQCAKVCPTKAICVVESRE